MQIEQDFALCAEKSPHLICHAIGAQFVGRDLIALFSFEFGDAGVALVREKHYKLVLPEDMVAEEVEKYRSRPDDDVH